MIWKNLYDFIKHNKILFILITVTQIVAVVIILFSYGIYRNNKYKLVEAEDDNKHYAVQFKEEAHVEFSRVREALTGIFETYGEILEDVSIGGWGYVGELDLEEEFRVYDEKRKSIYILSVVEYSNYRLIPGNRYDHLLQHLEGRMFTDEEFVKGDKVCAVTAGIYKLNSKNWCIEGEDYTVIANEPTSYTNNLLNWWFGAVIPYTALPDTMEIETLSFMLNRPLLRSEYEQLTLELKSIFPEEGVSFQDFNGVDIDEKATMKTMMLVAVFMSIISAFSTCIIYRYILEKRIKTTAVYRICGCTVVKSAMVYIKEMVLTLGASSITGCILFEMLVEPKLEKKYTWFSVIYKTNICYWLVLVYFILVAGVSMAMIFINCRMTPKEMLRVKRR